MTDYEHELLVIMAEECGETVQEICKIFRFGLDSTSHHFAHPTTHLECLTQELGDILAIIELLQQSDIGITAEGLAVAKQKKLEKVVKWMSHQKT